MEAGPRHQLFVAMPNSHVGLAGEMGEIHVDFNVASLPVPKNHCGHFHLPLTTWLPQNLPALQAPDVRIFEALGLGCLMK